MPLAMPAARVGIAIIPIVTVASVVAVIAVVAMVAGILVAVPIIANEIDRLPAGVIFAAMFAPVPFVSGWNAKVDRPGHHRDRWVVDHDGLRKDHRRCWESAKIDPPVEAGLSDRYRNADVRGHRRYGQERAYKQCEKGFHYQCFPL